MTKKSLRKYEDSAKPAHIKGWSCRHCKAFYLDEDSAKKCCANDMPCKSCGARHNSNSSFRYAMLCDRCRRLKQDEDWLSREAKEWDGIFPIAIWDDDVFFLSEYDIEVYLDNCYDENEESQITIDDLRFVECKERSRSQFRIYEFLDWDGEEDLWDGSEKAEEAINTILDKAPSVYEPNGNRLCNESIKRCLGWRNEQ